MGVIENIVGKCKACVGVQGAVGWPRGVWVGWVVRAADSGCYCLPLQFGLWPIGKQSKIANA